MVIYMKINLNEYIPSKYNELIYNIMNRKYAKYSIWGGRAGAKSTILALLIIIFLTLLEKFGGGNVMVFRKYKANMRKSLYAEVGKVAARLGIKDEFDFYRSPLMIVHKKTGHIALFDGMYDYQGVKGTTFENGVLCKLVIYEEFQEFDDIEDVEDNNLTFTRGDSTGEDVDFEDLEENSCQIVYAWNPLNDIDTFQNKKFRETTHDMYCLQVTYLDVPKKWLGKTFIKEAERIKNVNLDLYNFRFLGTPTAHEGRIYTNIELRPITNEEISGWFSIDEDLYVGLDFGYVHPAAANMMHYDRKNRILYIFKEFNGTGKNSIELSQGLESQGFLREYDIIADSEDPGKIRDLKDFGWSIKKIRKYKNAREFRIQWLQGLNKIVIDDTRCPETAKELPNYKYKKGGYPKEEDDHTDAITYGCFPVWSREFKNIGGEEE